MTRRDDIFDAQDYVRAMAARGELSPRAAGRLAEAIADGRDAYAYHSVVRAPFVWLDGRRYSADEWNAACEREALAVEGDAPAVVLWQRDTPGCYYVDGDGRHWSTFSGPPVACDACGATITGGYHSPGFPNLGAPDLAVCVAHVRTFGPSRAEA